MCCFCVHHILVILTGKSMGTHIRCGMLWVKSLVPAYVILRTLSHSWEKWVFLPPNMVICFDPPEHLKIIGFNGNFNDKKHLLYIHLPLVHWHMAGLGSILRGVQLLRWVGLPGHGQVLQRRGQIAWPSDPTERMMDNLAEHATVHTEHLMIHLHGFIEVSYIFRRWALNGEQWWATCSWFPRSP